MIYTNIFLFYLYPHIYISDYSIYPVSFGGGNAKLLLHVSLNGRYALMIQLISPAGENRPRTMTKIQKGGGGGGQLKGQEGFRNRAVGRAPWQATAAFRFVVHECTGVREGYTPKGTNERVETVEAQPRHATPKNPRDSAVFCERALRVRNFITQLADREQFPLLRKFVSFIEKTPTRPIGMHAACNSKE